MSFVRKVPVPDGWVNAEEAGSYLGMTGGAVRQAASRQQLPFTKFGKRLRFKISFLEAHMMKSEVRPAGEATDPSSEKKADHE